MQRSNMAQYQFISFYYDTSSGKHVAWYYTLITEQEQLKELVDGTTKE